MPRLAKWALTQGSLFDGAGGMRRGFEQAGFKTLWSLDLLTGTDIRKAKPDAYKKVDLISGGPPCQRGSFLAAIHSNRTKITLWSEMLQFITVLRPKWVVVENVIGFLPEMVKEWTPQLQQLGYGCAGQCIDSRHWVPQRRTRAFLIGRLGISGVALWHSLYTNGLGTERRKPSKIVAKSNSARKYVGACPDCLRGGVLTGLRARGLACLGAGNAVTVPVAKFLAMRILETENQIRKGIFQEKDIRRLF
jgi:site-specific DNA-cytosine methylase